MNDEQTLKRLAEIEFGAGSLRADDIAKNPGYPWWNPLTNWSDLGPLIEKYVTKIEYSGGIYAVYADAPPAFNKSLPHAIGLAIIEANGGMGDE